MAVNVKSLVVKYAGDATALSKTNAGIAKSTDGLASKLKAAGGKMVSAGKAASIGLTAPIVALGVSAVHAAEDARAKVRSIAATWKKDADAGALSFSGMQVFAEKFGDSIGQDDEAVLGLSGRIQNAVNLTKLFGAGGAQAGLQQMTQTVLDMSAATGKSSTMIQKLFNSVANDPKSAITTMLKLGVITRQQADHFTKLAAAGKETEVSQQLLAAASDKYAGAAQKAATPSEVFHAKLDNLQETLGGVLLPIFTKVVDWLGKITDYFNNLSPSAQRIVVIVLAVIAAIGPLLIVFGKLTQAVSTLIPVIRTLFTVLSANPWILIIAAVILVTIVIIKNWTTIKAFLLKIWGWIKAAVMTYFNAYKTVILAVWHAIAAATKVVWNAIKAVVLFVWRAIVAYVRLQVAILKAVIIGPIMWIKTAVVKAFDWVKDRVLAAWHAIAQGAGAIWRTVSGAFKSGVNVVIGAINWLIDQINKIQIHVHVDPPGPGSFNFDWNGPGLPHINPLAKGGVGRGWSWVGERGPELVNFGSPSRVLSNADSMAAVGGPTINVYVQGSVVTERELAATIRRQLLETKRRNGALGLS